MRFRKILCSTAYSIEQKLDGFNSLTFVYSNLKNMPQHDENLCQSAMLGLKIETDMRLGYQASREITAMVENML